MADVYIFHGSYGSPSENWYPWLKHKLEKLGFKVYVPKFPTPKNQSLESWLKTFEKYNLKKDSILIGHSIGAAFMLSLMELYAIDIKACIIISGFISLLGDERFDSINRTFLVKRYDFIKIKNNCKNFYVVHSDNDQYVPVQKAEEIAERLGVSVEIIPNAGHFNKDSGYTKFELLLRKIKDLPTTQR